MLLYNVIYELVATQLLVPLTILAIFISIFIIRYKEISSKLIITSLMFGITFTVLSLLIGREDFGGTLYYERFGWPAQFLTLTRNTDSSELPISPIPFNQTFVAVKALINIIIYASLTFLFISSLHGFKKKSSERTALSAIFLVISFSTIIIFSFLNKDQEETTKMFPTKEYAKSLLLEEYPELKFDPGLPPHNYYYSRNENSWYIVYTSEGSGLAQIFAVECFEVNDNNNVIKLGTYESKPESSYILNDITRLDFESCMIKDL